MSGDRALLRSLLPALVDNVQQWTASHWAADPGCFWQYADRDGQEHSIGGDGCRPLLGSVMFGEAHALARIARELGEEPTAAHFTREADRFRAAVLRLWSPELGFFVTRATPRPASVPRARWAERQTQLARERSSSSSSSSSSSRSSRSSRSSSCSSSSSSSSWPHGWQRIRLASTRPSVRAPNTIGRGSKLAALQCRWPVRAGHHRGRHRGRRRPGASLCRTRVRRSRWRRPMESR